MMKGTSWIFVVVVLGGFLSVSCGRQIQPTIHSNLEPTTALPSTVTLAPPNTAVPTATLPPLPRDIFDNFQDVVGYCKLTTAFGEVSPGQTMEQEVLSDTTIGTLQFALSWRGGDLELTLLQPDGRPIDSSALQADHTNLKFTSEPNYQEYLVGGPEPGIWRARISAASEPRAKSPYMLEVWVNDATIFSVDFDKDGYRAGDRMKISASIEDSFSDSPLGPEYMYGVVMKVIAEDPQQRRHSFELYDDGFHGDGKSDDGMYANTLAEPLVVGNYKFYFQLSGRNNRADEPFVRECFLGQTIRPIQMASPTASAGGQSCTGTVETSEPIIVRSEDTGGTDHSEFSRYALDVKGTSTSAGILVSWNMGYDGLAPEPNGYVRLLDDNAHPIGEMAVPFERSIGSTPSLITTENGAALTFCGVYEHAPDKITSVLFDPYGHFISEQKRFPGVECVGSGAQAVWTGSRFLYVQTLWLYGPTGLISDVLLEVADANGNGLFEKKLRTDGGTAAHFAVGHGQVLMVVPTRTEPILGGQDPAPTHIAVHRFDLEGNELGEGIILDPPSFDRDGQALFGEFDSAFVVPTSRGWMVLAQSRSLGYYVAQFAANGTLVSGPDILGADMDLQIGLDDVIPFRGGAVFRSKKHVFFLSDDGIIRQEWQPEPGEAWADAALIEHKGRLFIVYATVGKGKPLTNQILIRELRCVPE